MVSCRLQLKRVSGFPRLCLRTAYRACALLPSPSSNRTCGFCPHPAFVIGLRCRISQSRTSPRFLRWADNVVPMGTRIKALQVGTKR